MSGARELPSDLLILAAVERAQCHRLPRKDRGVPMRIVLEHLDVGSRTGRARHVRARVEELVDRGLLEESRRSGIAMWGIAGKGRDLLREARASGQPPVLPESPQHRSWREAHTAGEAQIERRRDEVGALLARAQRLLDADQRAGSDAWLDVGEALRWACKALASATHCAYEWSEPSDEASDRDTCEDPGDSELPERERRRLQMLRDGRRRLLPQDIDLTSRL